MRKIRVKSWKVVISSIVALGLIVLAFITRQWLWLIGSVALMLYNQYELSRVKKK